MPTALKMAEQIQQNGPLAVRAAKEAIVRGMSLPLDEGSGWSRSSSPTSSGPKTPWKAEGICGEKKGEF